jgi:hypothetical protein
VHGFGFWVLGFGFWVLGFGFWVKLQARGFRFEVFGVWVQSSGAQVDGSRLIA